ncbi:glycosyltransferase family 2 protein [Conidiobolus coronatus NRRL 28638]|uniref:Glycosyltransferase family 2 protein n=1 Tax=Conidiobolus coronatus (strain ATCC 28846 / CBS 209.66 / NRRL 28638) TaxID=796925 RepID=A0A137P5A7_CONC2|nr:glycosyltransferase family 2 protein [Conidiobolus coronatus NRRL 28638]|eukprot:KXN70187.1 glycosyltransferase family 2 protein [Conidiobolus coronatus NRRL 28638]
MVFCPQAVCKTIVPDEFSVLLSQRRRWINSTIHNLMELILVRNLCGTFCFSMQFVIFMELIGTVVLPVAIVMTFVLIVTMAQGTISSFAGALPLIMLVMVLFSPAILIFITTRKLIYIAWMVVYLIALPIWNFVLPVYSYWHFDDFSWGATRQVEGEAKGDSHGKTEGEFDSSKVTLRRWEDYERRRRRDIRRKEREAHMNHNRYESGDKLMYAQNPHEYDMSYYDNQSVISDGPGIGPEQHIYQYGSGSRHSSTYNTPVNFPVPFHNAYSDSRTPSTERHRDSTTMGSPYSYNRNQPRGPRPMQ